MNQAKVKPALRGVSHQVAAFIAFGLGLMLIYVAPTFLGAIGAAIYSMSTAALFGISAFYHRPSWKPQARQLLRRLDHSAIFIQIAGTYTPIVLLTFPQDKGTVMLSLAWGGAIIGILQSLVWPSAPKALVALLCVALGWLVVLDWEILHAGLTTTQLNLLATGGILYTIGAVIYALKRPDPWPELFGYHEIFHLLTIAASLSHAAVVYQLVVNSF